MIIYFLLGLFFSIFIYGIICGFKQGDDMLEKFLIFIIFSILDIIVCLNVVFLMILISNII